MEVLGNSEEEAVESVKSTVRNAVTAVSGRDIVVAGGIGPLPYSPCTEYYPNKYLSKFAVSELEKWHEPRFKLFYESDCDILAFETIGGTKEIEALLNLLRKYPKDAYLSLACSYHNEDCLNSNEPIQDALELVKRIKPPSLKGIGVNCTKPQYISTFGRLAANILPDLTLITYPNSGEEYHQEGDKLGPNETIEEGVWVGEKSNIVDYISEWKEIGFKWIGGCCRVMPQEIGKIKAESKKYIKDC